MKGKIMFRITMLLLALMLPGETVFAVSPDDIIRQQITGSVPHYYVWGSKFVFLQVDYFKLLFLIIIISTILLFLIHYILVGAKEFDENGEKIKFFNIFNRFIHWLAAFAFVLLVPTGIIIVFAKYFGGGIFVRSMRVLHDIGAFLFAISIVPLFVMWVKDMVFSPKEDLRWLATGGGYLVKRKVETGAGKFNLGQKFWFWIVVLIGPVMLLTGIIMYFQNIKISLFTYQIDLLRVSAILHNFLAMIIMAMFFVHLYMSLFVVKGSLKSMIVGYKSEDEVKYLHSSFYKKWKEKRKSK